MTATLRGWRPNHAEAEPPCLPGDPDWVDENDTYDGCDWIERRFKLHPARDGFVRCHWLRFRCRCGYLRWRCWP